MTGKGGETGAKGQWSRGQRSAYSRRAAAIKFATSLPSSSPKTRRRPVPTVQVHKSNSIIRPLRRGNHLVDGTDIALGVAEETVQPMLALLLGRAQHGAAGLLDGLAALLDVLDEPVDADAAAARLEDAGSAGHFLNTAAEAEALGREVEHLVSGLGVLGGVGLKVKVEDVLVELASW